MPFTSEKQRKFLWANEPEVARKFEEEAKRKGEPAVQPDKKDAPKKKAPAKKGKK